MTALAPPVIPIFHIYIFLNRYHFPPNMILEKKTTKYNNFLVSIEKIDAVYL